LAAVARTPDIALTEARELIRRAIDKAEDLGVRGAVAVVGGSGVLVSASRMDRSGASAVARARSKAWIAATQQLRSQEHLHRMATLPDAMARGFVACAPEAVFPGAGGMPIARADGVIQGGIAASGATVGPFVDYPGAVPEKLIANGQPANCEDLLVHYALGRPYAGQHGDDRQRWIDAYGEFPANAGEGLGMADPPPARSQQELAWALGLADRAIAAAAERQLRVAVAIVDHRGDPIQQDWMDGTPSAAVNVAQAVAAAAGTFQVPSQELAEHFPGTSLGMLGAVLPFPILAIPGGLPIEEESGVVAGIGIAGPEPAVSAELAAAALGG
jgi:uncharacterized protein GlcG (DUF336 family)